MPTPKPKTATTGRYIVRNPRGIPKDRHILREGDMYWYEGDNFVPPAKCDVARLLRDGFIEEAG